MPQPLDQASAADHPALEADLELAPLFPALPAELRQIERDRVRVALAAGAWGFRTARSLALVRPLPWDSDHFGQPCADLSRLYLDPAAEPPEVDGVLDAVLADARRRGIRLLSARLLTRQHLALAWLLQRGFALVDTSVEIGSSRPLVVPAGDAAPTRPARADDRRRLQSIAAAFTDNRFFRDARIPAERARAVYTRWVGSALDRGEVVVVESTGAAAPGADDAVAGFATIVRRNEPLAGGVGTIGLVVIDPAQRGRGLFDPLIDAAARQLRCRTIVSSTQVSNARALRAFARCGLLPFASRHVLHGWL